MGDDGKLVLMSEFETLKELVEWQLVLEKMISGAKARRTQHAASGKYNPEVGYIFDKIDPIHKEFKMQVARLLTTHPAYDWFSRIGGIGNENIAKVVALIDIEKANKSSSLWRYAGYGVTNGSADRKTKGVNIPFNVELKNMSWRVGKSLLQYHKKVKGWGESGTKYGIYYDKERERVTKKMESRGFWVGEIKKAPKGTPRDKIFSDGHVHNQAMRKMIKLFLHHLWFVWRRKEGLPAKPYYRYIHNKKTEIAPEEYIDHVDDLKIKRKQREALRGVDLRN